jgi:SsrA-binding protein
MGDGELIVTTNRKARHNYRIEDTLEAGLVLRGTEVKSLRDGKASLQEAWCSVGDNEVVLHNCHIPPYRMGGYDNHEPLRPRRLLLHRREIARLRKSVQQKGFTVVPLKLYFRRGKAKVQIGLARGKRQYDKRADIASRETERRLDRARSRHSDD